MSAASPPPRTSRREIAMRHGAFHVSAIALGVAAFVCVSPLSAAPADAPATSGAIVEPDGSAAALNAATPSLDEPVPTPLWAELGGPAPPSATTAPMQSAAAPSAGEPASTLSAETPSLGESGAH